MENWMFWLAGILAVIQIVFLIVDERIATALIFISIIGFFMLGADSINVYSIGIILVVHFISASIGMWLATNLYGEGLLSKILFVTSFSLVYLLVCVFGNTIVAQFFIDNAKYNQNVVTIEMPEVESTRYELVSSKDFEGMENVRFNNIIYVADNDYDYKNRGKSYYLIYCNDPVSGEINGATFSVVEDELEIKFQHNVIEAAEVDYLLVITEKYYKEDRNKTPYERRYTSEKVRYELHVTQETFNQRMLIPGR